MRYFMYVVIIACTVAAYVSSVDLAPGAVKYLPDLAAAAVMAFVVIEGIRQGFRNVDPKYWLIFGALGLTIACGPLANQEAVGPIIGGMRYYLRAMPLFLLPAVYNFTDRDLRNYMILVLGISFLQVPIAAYQKYSFLSAGAYTGDGVFGTLMISGILSLFLIGVLCIMASLMVRGRISKPVFAISFLLLVIPMSINETKATFLLLPLGLLTTFMLASPPKRRGRMMLQALAVLTVAGTIAVPVYDHFNRRDDGRKSFTIAEFFQPKSLDEYTTKKARIGSGEEAGRMDALRAPFKGHANDPVKLLFGVGLGNASKSSLGERFSGRYMKLYWNFITASSISGFLFELGILGTALILFLHGMVFKDVLYVGRRDDTLVGAMAPGFAGVCLIVTLGLFYSQIHTYESVAYMFWFFAGVFARRRVQLARHALRARAPAAAVVPRQLGIGGTV